MYIGDAPQAASADLAKTKRDDGEAWSPERICLDHGIMRGRAQETLIDGVFLDKRALVLQGRLLGGRLDTLMPLSTRNLILIVLIGSWLADG